MDDSPQPTSGMSTVLRGLVPPPALCGFLVLLTLTFALSYAVGSSFGPVAPGMHGTRTGSGGGDTSPRDGGDDTGGMGGMHG
jgi:hypothetical protein